jgi:hypothetical protein
MSAGGVWVAGTDSDSAARLNQKTVTIDTGTNLAGLAVTYPGMLVFATDNSSGSFISGTMYQRNPSNSGWVQLLPLTTHDHSTNQATTGGLLSDVLAANTGSVVYINLQSPRLANFNTLNCVSSGTVTDNPSAGIWRVKVDSGTTANGVGQADIGGIKVDFGSKIKFQAKIEEWPAPTSPTNVQGRIGINIEAAGTAPAAPPNAVKCLGFEFCDSTGANYQLVSSDGTRTVSSTGQPYNLTHAIKFLYTPASTLVGTVDQTIATTKSSNLPNSGACDSDKLMRFGITTTVITASKQLYVHGAMLVGTDNDVGWN